MKFAQSLLLSSVLSLSLAGPAYSQAESTSVDHMPPNTPEGVIRPTAGMSMEKVIQEFGEPDSRVDPVGEPPISRWEYGNYTVYFEHQYVIHSVVHR